jgi:DNA polymerase-3 subunit gamma/tau
MGQALYRQYRPKSLADVVGQEHITGTLLNALKSGKLAHAYLFTGPKGVGKTSVARILAHEINGLPYIDDSMHLDIIEIDAASNRRIDEIRELRDKVNVAPALAKYKVYIIDEVHMLTREAFNALLKTLEEPPAHVVFILATTETHKLPETIISRTQRFMFKPVEQTKVVAYLRHIADAEQLAISDEALELVAAFGEGSFRDSISLLDQTRSLLGTVSDTIGADDVRSLTGVPTDEAIAAITNAVSQADAAGVALALANLRDQGFAAAQVAKQLAKQLRQQVLGGQAASETLGLLEKLLDVPAAHDPDSYLEICLLGQALQGISIASAAPAVLAASTPPTPPASPKKSPAAPLPTAVSPATVTAPAKPTPAPTPTPTPAPTAPTAVLAAADPELWPAIIASLKKTHNTLYGIVRMAKPVFYEDAIELHFTFAFHKKRLSEAKNQAVVIGVIKNLTGREMALRCMLDKPGSQDTAASSASSVSSTAAMQPAGSSSSPVAAIANVFGGAEILES